MLLTFMVTKNGLLCPGVIVFMNYWKIETVPDLPGEIWKDVVGQEKLYFVSNYSRVKRKFRYYFGGVGHGWRTLEERIVSQHIHKTGYVQVGLVVNKKPWVRKVHRLVAEAFLPNPDKCKQVNHKDGNKLNNCEWNLEWCDQERNIQHALATGLMSKNRVFNSATHGKPIPILQYDLNGVFIKEWESITAASCIMSENAIKLFLKGTTTKPKNFIWKRKHAQINKVIKTDTVLTHLSLEIGISRFILTILYAIRNTKQRLG